MSIDLLPCSERAEALGEDMAGTAPAERGVLVVERSGPWGRDAVAESGLRPIADALNARARALGLRVQVVRKSTRRYAAEGCAAWVCDFGARSLERFSYGEPEDLLTLEPGTGEPVTEPMVLCCTHSTRDPCCARRGLPLHRALCVTGVDTWHASHLGGHRFAATMAALPLGVWLGRVPAEDAARVAGLLREERLPLEYLRGRAGQPPAVQAAEVAIRRHAGLDHVGDLVAGAVEDGRVTLTARDGTTYAADVRHVPTGHVRGVSCGADAKQEDPGRFEVRLVG
jgi:hypothetical protein